MGPNVLHRHTAKSLTLFLCFYQLCVMFLVVPNVFSAQVNHIESASRLLSEGNAEQAEAEARQALGTPATRALALAMLGTIRLQQGKYEDSTNFLMQALALNPRLVGARTTLGDAYFLEGKPELAKKNFIEALKIDPANFNARFDLAKTETALRNYGQSLEVANAILAQLRASDEGTLLLAEDYASLGKKEELRELIQARRHLDRVSEESFLEFANFLVMAGMSVEAQQVLETEEVKIHPSATLALKLGKAYLSTGAEDRAEKNFQLALSMDPACIACEQSLADLAERQGDTEKALAHLITAKKLAPEDPEVLFQFGKVCLERNLLEDAGPALAKAVALKPNHEPYVYVLGSAKVAQGKLGEARSLFGGLLEKHPRDAVLKYSVGAVDYMDGRYAEAEVALKESLKIQPDQVAASYYLGLTYEANGEDDRAAREFRELLKSHPQHAPSCIQLGSILVRKHEFGEAQQLLERGIALDPDSVQGHYQLGLLLRRLGRIEESDAQFAESRRLEKERSSRAELRLRLLLPE
jgi:tetratricopeptide (TPR) repeat protein